MEYISVKEASAAWGIHTSRITLLARNGRIPGAKQMGREWLIPKDAIKPRDARRSPSEVEERSPFFPFFLYLFRNVDSDREILDSETQRLYDAQLLYVRGELDAASEIFDRLLSSVKNRYILIGSLVTRGFIALELGQISQFRKCLQQLKFIFMDDFPYKTDLMYFFFDLESYVKGSEKWASEFHLDPEYSFHAEAGPYLITNIAYTALINLVVKDTPVDTSLLELSCVGLDDRGLFFSAQMVRIFLAGIYYLQGKKSFCVSNLRKVFDAAIENDSYYPLAVSSKYLWVVYSELFPSYPPEVERKTTERSMRFNSGVSEVYKFYATRSDLRALTQRDYEYIMFAMQGRKNKEIARAKGITAQTVSKYYSMLYDKLGVHNKKELIDRFRFSILMS